MDKVNVLITGGAGFIGSNLSRILRDTEEVDQIFVLDDFSTGSRRNIEEIDVNVVEGSILDAGLVLDLATKVDAIVHLAALASVPDSVLRPVETHSVNVTGTLNVLEAARKAGISKVIVASSSAVYGNNPSLPKNEDDWTNPLSPYAASKLATEAYAMAYQESYGIQTIAFRFFNVYGPGQAADHPYAAVIPKFISAILSGEPVQIYGDGLQTRDFTFVDTLCSAITAALLNPISSDRPINLAYNCHVTLLELLAELEAIAGVPVQRNFMPARIGDVRNSQADSTRITSLLPQIQPIELVEGLRSTLNWYAQKLKEERV